MLRLSLQKYLIPDSDVLRRSLSCKYCSRLVAACVWADFPLLITRLRALASVRDSRALSAFSDGIKKKKMLPSLFAEHGFLRNPHVRTKVKRSSPPRHVGNLSASSKAPPAALVDPIPNQRCNFGDEARVPQSRDPAMKSRRRGHLR